MDTTSIKPAGYLQALMYANQLFAGVAGSKDIKVFAERFVSSPEILKVVAFLFLCVQKHGRMHPEDGCPTEWASIHSCMGFSSEPAPGESWIPKFNTI